MLVHQVCSLLGSAYMKRSSETVVVLHWWHIPLGVKSYVLLGWCLINLLGHFRFDQALSERITAVLKIYLEENVK